MVGRHSDRKRIHSGFTLIDLTVVLLILGILVGATAPRLSGMMSEYRARSAASRLAADLRLARQFAIDKSSPQSIRMTPRSNRYVITTMDDPDHHGLNYTVHLADEPYRAQIGKLSFNASNDITFDIHGQCNFSGQILIIVGAITKIVEFKAENGEVIVL